MNRSSLVLVFLWLAILPLHTMFPQTTSLSGIINAYASVIGIDTCGNALLVDAPQWFFPGDKVLLIQMKGAKIVLSNDSTFGAILDTGCAGCCEYATVSSVRANRIVLQSVPLNRYDPSGAVQVVRVPRFIDVRVDGILTAPAWNGRTGGVLVLDASGGVELNADIDVSGTGYRGGRASVSVPTYTVMDYYHHYDSAKGGEKGEGIAVVPAEYGAGRGAPANGGGGGNAVNTGGGGGGNAGAGGRGGRQYIGSGPELVMGLGGGSIASRRHSTRLFPGGGGGGGHQNDGTGTAGGAGGGMAIVEAAVITGAGRSIIANGADADTAGNDGAGGGGAGGCIIVRARGNPSTALHFSADGGRGGSVTNTWTMGHCHGPGGGGGGGIACVTDTGTFPAQSTSVEGGRAGLIVSTNTPCARSNYGSMDGERGARLDSVTIGESRKLFTPMTMEAPPSVDLCPDSCTVLRARISGRDSISWLWTPSAGLSSTTDSTPLACPLTSTVYTVTATDRAGCSVSTSVSVGVYPRANIGVTHSGDTLIASPALTYRWFLDDTAIQGAVDNRMVPIRTGVYRVEGLDLNGCPYKSAPDSVVQEEISALVALGCPDPREYAPGEIVSIPIELTAARNLDVSGVTGFSATLLVKKKVLFPMIEQGMMYTDSADFRMLRLERPFIPSGTTGTLALVKFTVMLGDTACSPVILRSLSWNRTNTVTDIAVRQCGICARVCNEGGVRLFDGSKRVFLGQNHPNPIHDLTVIPFGVAEETGTVISILDCYGRVVAEPVNGVVAAGNHETRFDASRLPSGSYRCVLRTPTLTRCRLLVVAK
jgi:hypothetical protein